MDDPIAFIEQRKNALRRGFLDRARQYAKTLPPVIGQALAHYVDPTVRAEGTWLEGAILQSRSFALRNALLGIGIGTVAGAHADVKAITATGGIDPAVIPYAAIHEFGGFIASQGKMHKYFWAKFAETKLPFYRIMALSVLKKGGVDIKKHPFIAPGSRDVTDKLRREVPLHIADILHKTFNA